MNYKIVAIKKETLLNVLTKYYPYSSKSLILKKLQELTGKQLSWGYIQKYTSKNNIKRLVKEKNGKLIPLFKWTPEKDKKLRELWISGLTKEELVVKFLEIFNFPNTKKYRYYCWKALVDRNSALNKDLPSDEKLRFRHFGSKGKALTPTEDKLLKLFYSILSKEELTLIFWDRQWQNIMELASERNLRRPQSWSKEQKTLLEKHYTDKGAAYLSPIIGKDESTIRAYAFTKGLKRNPKKIKYLNNYSPNERKIIKTLYPSAKLYELYFNLPGRTLHSIHYYATNKCGLPKRKTSPYQQSNTPASSKLLMRRACREMSSLAGHSYSRVSYKSIVKKYKPEEIKNITNAHNGLFQSYYENIYYLCKKHLSQREIQDFQTKEDAVSELAQDAFYMAFDYIINWSGEDFMELINYYLANKLKFKNLGFSLSPTKFKDSRDLSISGVPNSEGNMVPEDYFLPPTKIKFIKKINRNNLILLFKEILTKEEMLTLIKANLGKIDINNQDELISYGQIISKLAKNKSLQTFAKNHSIEGDFLARISFILLSEE